MARQGRVGHERAGNGLTEVFISHTVTDKALADALKAALEELFGRGRLKVHYSSGKHAGGVPAGADWFRWIVDQVQSSEVAFVLLTPASVQKPWIPWEAGAVYGAALSRGSESEPVLPLTFHLTTAELPDPFRTIQVTRGDAADDVRSLFRQLLIRFKELHSDDSYMDAVAALDATTRRFGEAVEEALARAPMTPTEAAVSEWCLRLDALGADRASEASQMHDWIELAFGRTREEPDRPLDLRIHRRLGQLYQESGDHASAARQYELSRRLAPRDLFVLRSLGEAYLGFDAGKAERVIDEITALDDDAFEQNAECAALKGRWLRKAGNLRAAREVFERALARNPRSHYLAGRLAQTALDLQDPGYQDAFEHVIEIVEALDEQNVWTHADAVSAAVAVERPRVAERHLRAIAALSPTKRELRSIQRGLDELLTGLGRSAELPALAAILSPDPDEPDPQPDG